ncbi:hypothetical protein AB0L63_23865 [Nocardia sp. NPDC051990]|uniref:hypothetical protein n=1 Tax=Nocardia sp. NPDC051990 TaxID=3155285 RepID=UPI0034375C6B
MSFQKIPAGTRGSRLPAPNPVDTLTNCAWMPLEPKETVDGRRYRKISYGPPSTRRHRRLDSFHHFGAMLIDGKSTELTVDLCDATGSVLFGQRLTPPVR